MKRFIFGLLLLAGSFSAFSQKSYFIYVQSETEQPFFIKMNEKVFSSSATGYLILSNLMDSSYRFKVGFPQNKWPEQQFSVEIKSGDHGFLLKNFGEKGWGLFDLKTLAIQMAEPPKEKAVKMELKEVSAFTEVLSKAANDPSLKEKPVVTLVKEEEKVVAITPVVIKEEVVVVKEQPAIERPAINVAADEKAFKKEDSLVIVKEEMKEKIVTPVIETVAEVKPPKDSVVIPTSDISSIVTKKSESSTTEGFGLTFIDQYTNGQTDTITIVIPNSTSLFNKTNELPGGEKRFLDIEDSATAAQAMKKKQCSSASENDFLRLRKRMAAQKNDDAMINEAKKGFKIKCFSNEQVKNLGSLFLNEAGKFQFFQEAYPYSSAPENFSVLQTEFKDTYFIHRFKSLVSK